MSATAFQRRRRELAKQKEKELQQKEANKLEEEKIKKEIDYDELTKDEIKAILDKKGIEYNSKSRKDELIQLLKSE